MMYWKLAIFDPHPRNGLHIQSECTQTALCRKMPCYVTVLEFRGCRAADEASNHVFTLDTCQLTGQVIHIHLVYIGFSAQWNATDNPPTCGRYVSGCLKRSYNNEIMICNGKHNCTFSQTVLNFEHNAPLCSTSTHGNFVSIKYSCVEGKENCYIPSLFCQQVMRLYNFVFFT